MFDGWWAEYRKDAVSRKKKLTTKSDVGVDEDKRARGYPVRRSARPVRYDSFPRRAGALLPDLRFGRPHTTLSGLLAMEYADHSKSVYDP